MNAQQQDDLKAAVNGLAAFGRWASKNWKMLAVVVPTVGVFGDNLVGPALSLKGAQAAIRAAVEPVIEEQVQGAKADMDTLKTLVVYGFQGVNGRLDRQEIVISRLPGARETYRRIHRENQNRMQTDSLRRGLFGMQQ